MPITDLSLWQWLAVVQYELLLFAGVFLLLGALDDLALDFTWIWLQLTGQGKVLAVDGNRLATEPLEGAAAIFIPACQDAEELRDTITRVLGTWPQRELRLYVGCHRNDPAAIEAVMAAAPGDPRLRLVINGQAGPGMRANCLNRLYQALCDDEARAGSEVRMVLVHEARDRVDPAALRLLDQAIAQADLVQLPVLPMPQPGSRWIGSHFCEEFAEAQGKTKVVRDALRLAMPASGTGFAISRTALRQLADGDRLGAPFASDTLAETYELGLQIANLGGTSRFVRARDIGGRLIATCAPFPARLDQAVEQKARRVYGEAFEGWDRLGWQVPGRRASLSEAWMRLRDRREPLTALVLSAAYLLLLLTALAWFMAGTGSAPTIEPGSSLALLLAAGLSSFVWRAALRFAFTAREYGFVEGARALLRIPLCHIIAIMSAHRALFAYARSLRGQPLVRDGFGVSGSTLPGPDPVTASLGPGR